MRRFVRKNRSSIICEETTKKNCVAPCCVCPRSKQDIRSIFPSKYSVFTLKISQRAILITALMSGGCFETPRISERSSTIVRRCPVQTFLIYKSIADEGYVDERFAYKSSNRVLLLCRNLTKESSQFTSHSIRASRETLANLRKGTLNLNQI